MGAADGTGSPAGGRAISITRPSSNVVTTRRGSRIGVSFLRRARVQMDGLSDERFAVAFIDRDSGETFCAATLRNGLWAAATPEYFVRWRIALQSLDDASERYEYDLELAGRTVAIVNVSTHLGDTIAWMPYVEEFRRKHGCRVLFQTGYRDLFEPEYPEIRFVDAVDESAPTEDFFVSYGLALNLGDKEGFYHRRPYQSISLQAIAADLLGLEDRELRPRIAVRDAGSRAFGRYVCIGTQSTAQAKFWTVEGWEQVVDHLRRRGFEVLCIDRHAVYGAEGYWNRVPANCLRRIGEFDLHDRITDLVNCQFFVGLSSGLSWLAWALGKPTVLISGFTEPRNEFHTPYRVINREVCHGCWNDPGILFSRDHWDWCPRHGGTERMFECARGIGFEAVRERIDACIRDLERGGNEPAR